MNTQTHIHETIAWAKQRLDELDAGIAAAEKSLGEVNGDIRREADDALARLREARGKLQAHYDKLRAETGATKQGVKAVQDALEAEWVEVEAAFHSFTSTVGEHAQTARVSYSPVLRPAQCVGGLASGTAWPDCGCRGKGPRRTRCRH